jgi:hypothetical protein
LFLDDAATPRAVGLAALTGDRLWTETEAAPAAEVERERRQAVCDTKHVGAFTRFRYR